MLAAFSELVVFSLALSAAEFCGAEKAAQICTFC